MTCCNECKRWRGYKKEDGDKVDVAYCDDESCPCHQSKGEKQCGCDKHTGWEDRNHDFADCPHHSSTPATSWEKDNPEWEQELFALFGYHWVAVNNIVQKHIQAAEQRGREAEKMYQLGVQGFALAEAEKQTRQDILEELTDILNKLPCPDEDAQRERKAIIDLIGLLKKKV